MADKPKIEYRIISGRYKADVERRVTDLLNAGWMLGGYLQVNGNCGDYQYSQPMLKEEEEKA